MGKLTKEVAPFVAKVNSKKAVGEGADEADIGEQGENYLYCS